VLDTDAPDMIIRDEDFKLEWFSGTGAGGQHRNKHQNSARITHIPTGMVETAQCRSREASKRDAMDKLISRVKELANTCHHGSVSSTRKAQLGSGMRGDKIRTYRFQDDTVTDHVSGKRANLTKVMNGYFDKLWR
jgi:peptide chain release factor 1